MQELSSAKLGSSRLKCLNCVLRHSLGQIQFVKLVSIFSDVFISHFCILTRLHLKAMFEERKHVSRLNVRSPDRKCSQITWLGHWESAICITGIPVTCLQLPSVHLLAPPPQGLTPILHSVYPLPTSHPHHHHQPDL